MKNSSVLLVHIQSPSVHRSIRGAKTTDLFFSPSSPRREAEKFFSKNPKNQPLSALANLARNNSSGFSLVEILAALTILTVLTLLLTQVMNTVTKGTRISNRAIDAASQARAVFDRIGMDLAVAIKRPDADFKISGGSDKKDLLKFLSQTASSNPSPLPAGFVNRGVSLVSYRIDSLPVNSGKPCLSRASKAISWNMPAFIGLKTNGLPISFDETEYPIAITSADLDVVSPSVIHAVVGVQLYPDGEPVYFQGEVTPTILKSYGQVVYRFPVRAGVGSDTGTPDPGNTYLDLNRIASLVVGLVVVDGEALKILDSVSTTTLASSFISTPNDGILPMDAWMKATQNLTKLPDSIPLPVRQSVRLYQRFYPITPYGSRNR